MMMKMLDEGDGVVAEWERLGMERFSPCGELWRRIKCSALFLHFPLLLLSSLSSSLPLLSVPSLSPPCVHIV